MKFIINNDNWEVIMKDHQTILDELNSDSEDKYYYAFGLIKYPIHEIWINKDMCIDQQIKTLKHELTHCYIWNFGLYNVPNFNEEMVCDLISSCNDFIHEVSNNFKNILQKEQNNEKVD